MGHTGAVLLFLAVLALASARSDGASASVSIDTRHPIGQTASGHVGLVFDGYTTDQHDPERTAAWAHSNWVQADLTSPALRTWVKALAEPTGDLAPDSPFCLPLNDIRLMLMLLLLSGDSCCCC